MFFLFFAIANKILHNTSCKHKTMTTTYEHVITTSVWNSVSVYAALWCVCQLKHQDHFGHACVVRATATAAATALVCGFDFELNAWWWLLIFLFAWFRSCGFASKNAKTKINLWISCRLMSSSTTSRDREWTESFRSIAVVVAVAVDVDVDVNSSFFSFLFLFFLNLLANDLCEWIDRD